VSGIARIDKDTVSVMASAGSYVPKPDDLIIGVVEEVTTANWFLSTDQPYRTILPGEEASRNPLNDDLTKYYKVGDIVSGKIRLVDEVLTSVITRPWKMTGGMVVQVNPQRVSRIIGKKRSMLEMIKQKTGCSITVGQNGWIWVKGQNESIAVKAIKKIEAEAHTQGLTARIERMLDEKIKRR
jgi:exosome complex component RRP4